MQSFCRIIRKKSLEMSKSHCTLIKIIIILYCIIAGRTFYKEIYSPVFSCRIYKIRKAIITFYQSKRLSLRISAILDDLFTKPGSNAADILHQFYRFLKNTLTHSLQNITFCSLWCLVGQSVCIKAKCTPGGKQAKNYKKLFLKRGMRKTITFKGIR